MGTVQPQTQTVTNGGNVLPPKPNNYMVLAIVTTVCCCLPFGIVGIVKASKVNSLYALQQYAAAQAASEEAKKWSLIGIGCGAVVSIIYLLVYGFAAIEALNQ